MKYLSVLFAGILFYSCTQQQAQITAGVSEELAQQRKAVLSEINYDLSFNIPAQKAEKINGKAVVRFNLKEPRQNLAFDFKGDTTKPYQVISNGKSAEISIKNGHLVIDKSNLKVGQNEIQFQFVSPDWSLNRNPDFLYTLFVPDRASTAFPCFDQPNLKAKFKLQIQIPASWKAVANGSVEKEQTSDSIKTLDFRLTQPLPTYLFAFSTGKFDTISRIRNGKTCVLYHREKDEELKNNTDSIFSLVFRSLSWIEQYTKISYPFEKYDLVAIPSFQYNGMEHPGATLYRASSLFLDSHPTQQQFLKRANLIAHETAHMWFGDLVTMSWFDEVWLKEVFANFIADKVVSPMFPNFNFDLQFLLAHYDAAYSVDRTSGANAIGQKLANMKDAGSLYGSIIYHKAPIVMRMLEQKTGEAALQKGLQQYLSQNAYGNAGWKELISILNKPKSEGLPQWSDAWVNEAGRPHLIAIKKGNDLIVEQKDPRNKNRIWSQELNLAFAENGKVHQQKISMNAEKIRIANVFTGANPEWIYLNAQGKVYGFVALDSITSNYFLNHFSTLSDDLLRASVLTDLSENLYEGKLPPEKYLNMAINQLSVENNAVIYESLLSSIERVYLYKTTSLQQQKLCSKLETTLWSEYAVRNNHQTALINCLMKVCKTEASMKKFLEYLGNNATHPDLKLSTDQQNTLAFQLALGMPERAIRILDEHEKCITNPDKKAGFQFVRKSLNPAKNERDKFFQSLLLEENREHEPWVEQALAYLNHPSRQSEALSYIRPALDKLQEIQKTGDIFFPQSWLTSLLKGHNSAEAAAIVKQFLADHPDYPENLKQKILQSADHLLRL